MVAREVVFASPDESIMHHVSGWLNVVSNRTNDAEVNTIKSSISVNFNRLAQMCGFPDSLWVESMPSAGWTVSAINKFPGEPEKFMISHGSKAPDFNLGIIVYFLDECEDNR